METTVYKLEAFCPKCGRKLLSSVSLDHDGYEIYHSLPKHKPKGYNKQKRIIRKRDKSR